uniref:hypothetical protein n=1 Tax=Trichocoleus desertorum TaxID=1481672 RepID=UPI0025B2F1FB|nr:hypothetical protein [Trichocoleus desertorum]
MTKTLRTRAIKLYLNNFDAGDHLGILQHMLYRTNKGEAHFRSLLTRFSAKRRQDLELRNELRDAIAYLYCEKRGEGDRHD